MILAILQSAKAVRYVEAARPSRRLREPHGRETDPSLTKAALAVVSHREGVLVLSVERADQGSALCELLC